MEFFFELKKMASAFFGSFAPQLETPPVLTLLNPQVSAIPMLLFLLHNRSAEKYSTFNVFM